MKNEKILIYFILYAIHIPQASLASSDDKFKKFVKRVFIKPIRNIKGLKLQNTKKDLTRSMPNLLKGENSHTGNMINEADEADEGYKLHEIILEEDKNNPQNINNDTIEQTNPISNLCTLNELSMSLPDLFEKLEEKSKKKPASNPYLSTKKQKTKDYHPKRYISTEKLYATEVLILTT